MPELIYHTLLKRNGRLRRLAIPKRKSTVRNISKLPLEKNRFLRIYDILLNRERRLAKRRNRSISLRNKEFGLLELFMVNRGRILTRDDIFDNVWDRNADQESNTVDSHVYRLRKKIDQPFKEKLIHTIPMIGYVFERRNGNEK